MSWPHLPSQSPTSARCATRKPSSVVVRDRTTCCMNILLCHGVEPARTTRGGQIDHEQGAVRDESTPRPDFRGEIRAGDRAPLCPKKRQPRRGSLRYRRQPIGLQNPCNRGATDAVPDVLLGPWIRVYPTSDSRRPSAPRGVRSRRAPRDDRSRSERSISSHELAMPRDQRMEASEAPSTERDGNRWALLNTTAPTSTRPPRRRV
jgi:hypothetical protein